MARTRSAKPSTSSRDLTAPADAGSALKPCPNCGKREGKLLDRRPARFPFAVVCGACGYTTTWVRLAGVAQEIWNKAMKK